MSGWEPIATAPKDGRVIPCSWEEGEGYLLLAWKTNPRTDSSYFGDPYENDDYHLADNPPTHWFDLPEPPRSQ